MLNFLENHLFLASYVVGFCIFVFDDMKIFSDDFIFFIMISPVVATFTGLIAIIFLLLALMPIVYLVDIIKMLFCKKI